MSTRLGLIAATEHVIRNADMVEVTRKQTAGEAEARKNAEVTSKLDHIVHNHNMVKRFLRYVRDGLDRVLEKFDAKQLRELLKLGGVTSKSTSSRKLAEDLLTEVCVDEEDDDTQHNEFVKNIKKSISPNLQSPPWTEESDDDHD